MDLSHFYNYSIKQTISTYKKVCRDIIDLNSQLQFFKMIS
jgi:hypothetical protein